MQIYRSYARQGTAVASVSLEAPDGEYKLDGNVLPESSVQHLLTFALQSLQDAYAGAKDSAEAEAAFAKKYQRLLDGSVGVRAGGTDTFTKTCRQIARQIVRAKMREAGRNYKDFTDKSASEQNAMLDQVVDANREVIEKEARKRMDDQDKLSKQVDIDL